TSGSSQRPTAGVAQRPPWAADGIALATAVLGRRVAVDWAGSAGPNAPNGFSDMYGNEGHDEDTSVTLEATVDV
ncbi:hypothetical protein HDU93_005534, partial [Gonapodya sp. JEL0774]